MKKWEFQISGGGKGQIVWFTSSYFLEAAYNAASSGANSSLGMNALSSLIGETEAMAIRSKSPELQLPDHQQLHRLAAESADDRRVPAGVPQGRNLAL